MVDEHVREENGKELFLQAKDDAFVSSILVGHLSIIFSCILKIFSLQLEGK